MTLDQDFGARRRLEVDVQRTVSMGRPSRAPAASFVDMLGQGHAADERNGGLDAERQGEGHGLADVGPCLRHHADMLLRRDDARQALAVDPHHASDRPIGPGTIRRAGDDAAPGVEVPPPVAMVQQRNGQAVEIDIVARRDVLETGGVLDDHRIEGRLVEAGGDLLHDIEPARVGGSPSDIATRASSIPGWELVPPGAPRTRKPPAWSEKALKSGAGEPVVAAPGNGAELEASATGASISWTSPRLRKASI